MSKNGKKKQPRKSLGLLKCRTAAKGIKMTYKVYGAEETERIGALLAKALKSGGRRSAYIAMRGEMGVGKTVFTRGFAGTLGIRAVKSPTYTVVNEYRGEGGSIFHFDMYRIEDALDLSSIGYDDYLYREGYIIVEWSERIPEEIPDDAITVTISRLPEDEAARLIEIENIEIDEA